MKQEKEKIVLAYSGGLDTSVAIAWLKNKGYDVIACCIDVVKARTWKPSRPKEVKSAPMHPSLSMPKKTLRKTLSCLLCKAMPCTNKNIPWFLLFPDL